MSKLCNVTTEWRGEELKKRLKDAEAEMVWLAAQDAITKSVNNAPIDTGTLRRSGVVTMGKLPFAEEVYWGAQQSNFKSAEYSEGKKNNGTGEAVAYASYNTPYALKLHEDANWTPRRGGGPKWLEKAIPLVKANWNKYVQRAKRKAGL